VKPKRISASFYIPLGIVLGMIPPVAYHLITTRQLPVPVSFWDSRPCCADPGPLTCDGILPYAPGDLEMVRHGKLPGNGICVDQKSKQYQAYLDNQNGNSMSAVTLWWLPACQSAFASTEFVSDDGDTPMTAQLVVTLPGDRWTNEAQRATSAVEFDGSLLWTTLVWIHPGASVAACGSATVIKITYSTCTPFYHFN
jgi:hypothetical protein